MTGRKRKPIGPGDRVRLSARFLVFTGQRVGGEGPCKWTVRECPCDICKAGTHVAVDEPNSYKGFTAEELEAMPWLNWRHIAEANLVRIGEASIRDDVPLVGKLPIGA